MRKEIDMLGSKLINVLKGKGDCQFIKTIFLILFTIIFTTSVHSATITKEDLTGLKADKAQDVFKAFTEMLVDTRSGDFYVFESKGKRFIPAFIAFNTGAIELQNRLNAQAMNDQYARVGSDFKSFLENVQKQVNTDTPIKVFRGDLVPE